MGWTREDLCFSPIVWFEQLEQAISSAQRSVLLEVYILEKDDVGGRIWTLLTEASRRGVSVRLIVDGFGSATWIAAMGSELLRASFETRIFHPLPVRVAQLSEGIWKPLARAFQSFTRLNRRDHRKLLIIDEQTAWVGSWNLSASHFGKEKPAWNDSGCILAGDSMHELVAIFERAWRKSFSPQKPGLRSTLHRLYPIVWRPRLTPSRSVFLMDERKTRKAFRREIYQRIQVASERVWLTTAYFVPTPKLVLSLIHTARAGTDVSIMVPARSDVALVHTLGEFFYRELVDGGVRIFEYQRTVLHAKTLIAGDWVLLGSLNMNFRSFYQDYELGVVLSSDQARRTMAEKFLTDLRDSREVIQEDHRKRPLWHRMLSFVLFRVRFWF